MIVRNRLRLEDRENVNFAIEIIMRYVDLHAYGNHDVKLDSGNFATLPKVTHRCSKDEIKAAYKKEISDDNCEYSQILDSQVLNPYALLRLPSNQLYTPSTIAQLVMSTMTVASMLLIKHTNAFYHQVLSWVLLCSTYYYLPTLFHPLLSNPALLRNPSLPYPLHSSTISWKVSVVPQINVWQR